MKKDYIFLSISIDVFVISNYDGGWDIHASSLSTNVNTMRINLVGGCWELSLPEAVVGNSSLTYHLPILLIKFRRIINNPLEIYPKINNINLILNKFEKFTSSGFKLSTLDKQKLQDDLIDELASTYGDKILRVNKL